MLRSIFARTALLAVTAAGLVATGCASRSTVAKLQDQVAQTQREADRTATQAAIAQQAANTAALTNQTNQAAMNAQSEAALASQKAEQALREANEARTAAAAAPSTDNVTVTEETVTKPVYKKIGRKHVKRRIIHHSTY